MAGERAKTRPSRNRQGALNDLHSLGFQLRPFRLQQPLFHSRVRRPGRRQANGRRQVQSFERPRSRPSWGSAAEPGNRLLRPAAGLETREAVSVEPIGLKFALGAWVYRAQRETASES